MFLAFQKQEVVGSGLFYVPCPSGWFLLSCGTENTVTTDFDPMRYTLTAAFQTCECYDLYGMKCSAWCTDKPLTDLTRKLSLAAVSVISSSCPLGSKLTSCSLKQSLVLSSYSYLAANPDPFQHGCTCANNQGSWCVASCAVNIKNHEVIRQSGSGKVLISCKMPENSILGCGISATKISSINWPFANVLNQTTCEYYGEFDSQFYAICGLIFTEKSPM